MNISNNNNTATEAADTYSISLGRSMSDSCKDSASSSSSSDGVGDDNNMLQADDKHIVSVCANCGKEGNDKSMNICNKCKLAKYCNATCKKKHRHKHKKECEKRVAEQHDKELFKEPPPVEDCPICFLLLPLLMTGKRYYECCGKEICSGCVHAPLYDNQGNVVDNQKCPFCRRPPVNTDEEEVERFEKLMDTGDAFAIHYAGCFYKNGKRGLPQDYKKALELFHRAAQLGHAESYCYIAFAHNNGEGVEVDTKKAEHYLELAAMKGSAQARWNLGNIEYYKAGNMDRALKHYMIAVRNGISQSLEKVKQLYSNGHATKDDYAKALRLYQEYLGDIKSRQRDAAAAVDDDYRYY